MAQAPSPEYLVQLATDDEFRFRELYRIVSKDGKSVPFVANSIQRRILSSKTKRRMILKARQFGISSLELIRMFDFALWNPNTTVAVISHDDDSRRSLFRIIRHAYDSLPVWAKVPLASGPGSMYELRLANGSRIFADNETRSVTLQWLHISEFAFIQNEDKVKASLQSVPLNGRVTIESTPAGTNHFFREWNDERSEFEKIFLPWYLHDEYKIETPSFTFEPDELALIEYAKKNFGVELTHAQIAFRRSKQIELKHLFIQEFPEDPASCFLSSGRAALDLTKIADLLKTAPDPISEELNGTLRIYEEAREKGEYVIGCDCSEGTGGDYSVAVVIDATTRKQVAVLRSNSLRPSEFANQIYDLAERYCKNDKWPLVAVERNGHGGTVLLQLSEHLHYPNLYEHIDEKTGWLTSVSTRAPLMDAFVDSIENKTAIVQDKWTLQECMTLIHSSSGKIEAGPNSHDDCIMACAIGLWLSPGRSNADFWSNIGSYIRLGDSRSDGLSELNPYDPLGLPKPETLGSGTNWRIFY